VLTRRVIVCLDVQAGRVVKGVNFGGLRDVGEPVALATRYEADGADEITFLDITASVESRDTMLDVARQTAERLFIPLTIGGGVRTADDVGRTLRAGADKVALNSAIVANPTVLTACADRFGAQCVVASIDAKRDESGEWRVWTHGGRTRTDRDAIEWAEECVARGAGEILLTSIDRDGARSGYDLPLLQAVAGRVTAPVIASGGAGAAEHVVEALREGRADAALLAGILHDNLTTVTALKESMRAAGLPTR
jgi:imidazole glycerol-phosphate synthase subunit HisF